jgi:GNAT superfamily N-acetyltransferase
MNITIQKAIAEDAQDIAEMVGELLNEIMTASGVPAFHFNLQETIARIADYISREKYFVFVARSDNAGAIGFIALCESYALYAEGAFGIIPEFYVRPAHRSQNVGSRLLAQAKSLSQSRNWKRLEVTTPPLPQFEKSLLFYQREGFAIAGGRKLRLLL